ncbi:MAG: glycosyltransferase family 25 protein [Pirellulales bacterium]
MKVLETPAAGLLTQFERIVVVNLPERTDRRREMEAQLRSAGVDPQDERVQFFAARRPTEVGDWPSLGARGCFQSHLQILQRAREDELENILVLEDDCDFTPGTEGLRYNLVDELDRREWDLAYLGHPVELKSVVASSWVASGEPFQQSHCYAVNGRALPKVVAFLEAVASRPAGHPDGGPQHYDGALNMFRQQNHDVVTLLAAPSLAHQRSSRSDIYEHWYDRVPGLRQLFELRRRVKKLVRGQLNAALSPRRY